MRRAYRVCRLFCCLPLILSASCAELHAEHPLSFPWHGHKVAAGSARSGHGGRASYEVYQILTPSNPTESRKNRLPEGSYQALSPKSRYAYGWFGSNPQPIWGRHFGYSGNNTQWSKR